jgi:hypothetical protein
VIFRIHTVSRVVDSDDDTRSQHNLLPGLANVDHIDTIGPCLPQVRLHVDLKVLAAEMRLGSEQHLDILRCGIKDGGKVARSHLEGLASKTALFPGCGIEVRDVEDFLCGQP